MNYHFYGVSDQPSDSLKQAQDSIVIRYSKMIYKGKIDPQELADIKEEMDKSVRPPEPIPPPLTWYEKLFGREPKLFESDEWKNRNKNNK